MDILDILISKENITGIWAVIGAVTASSITLFGIFINNLFENNRKRKDRQYALVVDGYNSALQYLAKTYFLLMKVGGGKIVDMSDIESSSTEKFYKLFLIASPKVADSFIKLSSAYSSVIYSFFEKQLSMAATKSEMEVIQIGIDGNNKIINDILEDMKNYNRENMNNPEKFSFFQEQYSKSFSENEGLQLKIDLLQKKQTELQFTVLAACLDSVLKTSPLVYEVIFLMREDIERNLRGRDIRKIKKSFDLMIEQMRCDFEKLLDVLNKRISEMELQ